MQSFKLITNSIIALFLAATSQACALNQATTRTPLSSQANQVDLEELFALPAATFFNINLKVQTDLLQMKAKSQGKMLSCELIHAYKKVMTVAKALATHSNLDIKQAGLHLAEYAKFNLIGHEDNIELGLQVLIQQIENEAPLLLTGGDFSLNTPMFNNGKESYLGYVASVNGQMVTIKGGYGSRYKDRLPKNQ